MDIWTQTLSLTDTCLSLITVFIFIGVCLLAILVGKSL